LLLSFYVYFDELLLGVFKIAAGSGGHVCPSSILPHFFFLFLATIITTHAVRNPPVYLLLYLLHNLYQRSGFLFAFIKLSNYFPYPVHGPRISFHHVTQCGIEEQIV